MGTPESTLGGKSQECLKFSSRARFTTSVSSSGGSVSHIRARWVDSSLFGFSAIAFPFAKGVALLAICRALGRRLAVVGLKLQQVVTT